MYDVYIVATQHSEVIVMFNSLVDLGLNGARAVLLESSHVHRVTHIRKFLVASTPSISHILR